MITYVLLISLITPSGERVASTDTYQSKITCEKAKNEARAAMKTKPNGYILVEAKCSPVIEQAKPAPAPAARHQGN